MEFTAQDKMTESLDDAHAGRLMTKYMMTGDAETGMGAFTRKQVMPDWTGA